MRTLTVIALIGLAACAVSQDQEVEMGKQNSEQVNAQLPLIDDPAITEYVNALGKRIADSTSRSDLQWHFYVVNASEANAFALPGGFIYVNRGLIDLTSNESELAGAMAHEIGHVIQRHAVKQMEQQEGAKIGIAALCSLTNVCNHELGRAAIGVGGTVAFAHNSRKDESQADSEAVVNTLRAGIDPRGVPSLFASLLKTRQTQPNVVDGWFADHPFEESRIAHSKALIGSIDPSRLRGLETDAPTYHEMKSRLDALPAAPAAQKRSIGADSTSTDTEPQP